MSRSINRMTELVLSSLLIAIGILIPMYSPIKIILEPASFTLASHVVIFVAMFISPFAAVSVAFGTTVGFFLGGFPIVIVIRAATHLVFAMVGSLVIKKQPQMLESPGASRVLSFFIALLHAVCEVAATSVFYFGNGMSQSYYAHGYVYSVILLVGVGTVVHSMVDFELALLIWKPLSRSM